MKRALLLLFVVGLGVLVVLGAIVLARQATTVSIDLGPVPPAGLTEAEAVLGPVKASTSISVSRGGPLGDDLVSTWSWREPGGEWRPIEFEGLCYFDADPSAPYVDRSEFTGVRDGRIVVEASYMAAPVEGGAVNSSLLMCEVDGALAVTPWHEVVNGVEPGSQWHVDFLGEPWVLPRELGLPPLSEADFSSKAAGSVDQGVVEAEVLLKLKDRRRPELESVFEFRVQVESVGGS
ncbi:hypothetical protein [Engelhardtia mirabilis]|uniref:Uncharacterized protein n=1 Tax=Engelhardtia mirabilis TaxID=2528011 RepID=A0A518BR71_9BACT|nr:hypothetical protein Pla133_45970 [Planctomycetes bacterium Pla133]QDV03803.1 hypothetical protein Pla86_45950 [Planctomycetes bacterium Pla86]